MKKTAKRPLTDEEIMAYDNVPIDVAARYIGWSSPTIYRALREGEGAEGEVRRSHPGRDGEGHAAAGRDRGSQPGGGAAVRVPPHHH